MGIGRSFQEALAQSDSIIRNKRNGLGADEKDTQTMNKL
jgi:hypothetical protein